MKVVRNFWILLVAAFAATGCGAGSADIPANLPAPTKISPKGNGEKLEDIAKSQGLTPPVSSPGRNTKNFNPTNMGHPTNPTNP